MSSTPVATLVLPCLNELDALRWLIPRIPPSIDVVLVDNGSDDGSREYARAFGWRVLDHPRGREPGRCVDIGIADAKTDIVCVADCDGTIDPIDILSLIAPLTSGRADFVIGARTEKHPSRTKVQRFASRVRDALVRSLLSDVTFPDLGSSRAFRRSAFDGSVLALNSRFGWNLHFTIYAVLSLPPERIITVDIPYLPRIGKSKIAGHRFGQFLAVTDQLKIIFGARRSQGKPSATASALLDQLATSLEP